MKKYLSAVAAIAFTTTFAVAQQAVDIHTHNILPVHLELLEKHNAELEETFPLPAWDAEAHLKFMQEAGIDYAVLSMPAPQPFYGDAEESRTTIREVNRQTADIKNNATIYFIVPMIVYNKWLDFNVPICTLADWHC